MKGGKIAVLDFGSQYAHLIAKRFRMLGYYSEIKMPSAPAEEFSDVRGIVMSGGPSSVYADNVPEFNERLLDLDIPVLGLCYGHQLMNKCYGGKVEKAVTGEFGIAHLSILPGKKCPLFKDIPASQQVWMSHQDSVTVLGDGFEAVGSTNDCEYAAVQNLEKKRFGLQFHVEVKDTPAGSKILANFAKYCGMKKNWDQATVLDHIINTIRVAAGDRNVLLFLSGGVDSTVAFALLNKALGQNRVLGLHIDNGFMRKNESAIVAEHYHKFGFTNFLVEDASESFLKAVYHLTDPQKKRMAVGENFITVRNRVVAEQQLDEDKWMLAQGTLYPDIIESGGTKNSKIIKTHHNRVAGIQALIEKGCIIEPLKDLYKDEVRNIGRMLGLNDELVMRHPFPGPGLSINVLCTTGEMTGQDETDFTKAAAEIETLTIPALKTDSFIKYVIPVRSVGVQGDFRTYRFPSVLSFGEESEGGFYPVGAGWDSIEAASSYITNNTENINRTIIRLYEKSGATLKLQEGYCDKRRLDQLRAADDIVLTELHKTGWYNKIFQHLTIDLPYASSAGSCSFVLRPVVSEDVMTARFAHLPENILTVIVRQIAALGFVDAVYFDATNKPPATFGWE